MKKISNLKCLTSAAVFCVAAPMCYTAFAETQADSPASQAVSLKQAPNKVPSAHYWFISAENQDGIVLGYCAPKVIEDKGHMEAKPLEKGDIVSLGDWTQSETDYILYDDYRPKEDYKIIRVPASIIYDGIELTVSEIARGCMRYTEEIYYPATIRGGNVSLGYLSAPVLKAIHVDADNPYFSSINGVLYNKAANKLLAVPAQYAQRFIVPNTVDSIGGSAFTGPRIKNIEFEENSQLKYVGYAAFDDLFLDSIKLPVSSNEITLEPSALRNDNLKYIYLSESVKTLEESSLGDCSSRFKKVFELAHKSPDEFVCHGEIFGDYTDNTNAFLNFDLIVPDGCKQNYANVEPWSRMNIYEKSEYAAATEIEEITGNDAGAVYNLQGICIKRNATREDVHSLPAGIYIFNGEKILVK